MDHKNIYLKKIFGTYVCISFKRKTNIHTNEMEMLNFYLKEYIFAEYLILQNRVYSTCFRVDRHLFL